MPINSIQYRDLGVYYNGDRLLTEADGFAQATSGVGAPVHIPDASNNEPFIYVNQANGDLYAFNDTTDLWELVSGSVNIVDNANGTYTVTDPEGNTTLIDTRANSNPYVNTTSGLTATNVQAAIDEVDGSVDNIVTTLGTTLTDTHLGVFTGSTIADNSTLKAALQALETAQETGSSDLAVARGSGDPTHTPTATQPLFYINEDNGDVWAYNVTSTTWENSSLASNVAVTPAGNLASTTVQTGLEELQGDIDTINNSLAQPNGIATLDASGHVLTSQIPALAITDVYVVADIAARDALTVQTGDVVKVTDSDGSGNPQTYIYDGTVWIDIQETSNVISVFGRTGVVAAQAGDYTATQVTYSNAVSGLTATDTQAAIDEVEARVTAIESITYTAGSLLFAHTDGTVTQNNTNLFYDNTNTRLGVGVNTPSDTVDVNGTVRVRSLPVAAGTDLLVVADAVTGQLHQSATDLSALESKWTNNSVSSIVELTNLSDGTTVRPAGTQFVVADSGNVGIRTSVPTSSLTIAAGNDSNTFSFEGLMGTTSSIALTEIFVQGVAGSRISIPADSVADFVVTFVAKDTVTDDVGIYRISGGVKSDAAGTVTIVGSPTKTIVAEDDTFDVLVAADDANDALAISVQGATANSTNWAVKVEITITEI